MREIKFRALVEKSGKSHPAVGGFEQYNQIIKVESITFNDDGVDLVVDENGDEYSYHDETLLVVIQYTGLKDSNGVDIYVGDIITTSSSGARCAEVLCGHYEDAYGAVDSEHYGLHTMQWGTLPDVISDGSVVIGNKYEHPHLLEVE